jgi:hypothetical protein
LRSLSRPPVWLAFLLALSLLIPFPVVLHAAAAIVQSAQNESCGTPCTVTFGGNVTTGNAVIVRAVCINNCVSDVMAASDATNGAYTKHVELMNGTGSRTSAILSKRNVTGGFTVVTVTSTGGASQAVLAWANEVSGLSTAGTVLTDSKESATATSKNCSTSGLTGSGFSACVASSGDNNPNNTPGTGWTESSSDALFAFAQHRVTAVSSDLGPWTSSANANATAVQAMFPEAASAGGCRAALNLLGVGGC